MEIRTVLMKLACVAALVSISMLAVAPQTEAGMSCGTVTSKLAPCLMYLRNGGGAPPSGCCNAIRTLNGMARSTPGRQAACSCLKSAATSIPGINMRYAASLPDQCRANIGYLISTRVDCSRVR